MNFSFLFPHGTVIKFSGAVSDIAHTSLDVSDIIV